MNRDIADAVVLDADVLFPVSASFVRSTHTDCANQLMQDIAIQLLDPNIGLETDEFPAGIPAASDFCQYEQQRRYLQTKILLIMLLVILHHDLEAGLVYAVRLFPKVPCSNCLC